MSNKPCPKRIKLHSKRCALSVRVMELENVIAEFDFDHPVERLVIDGLLSKRDALSAEIVAIDVALGQTPVALQAVKFGAQPATATNVIAFRPNGLDGTVK